MPTTDVEVIGKKYKSNAQGKTLTAPEGQTYVRDRSTGKVLLRPAGNPTGEKQETSPAPAAGSGDGQSERDRSAEKAAQRARDEAVQAFQRQQQELLEQQRRQEDEAFEAFRRKVEGQPRGEDIFRGLEEEKGVDKLQQSARGIRQKISDLESQLEALPEQLQDRTRGTMTTQSQFQRMLAKARQPIVKELASETDRLGIETASLAEARKSVSNLTELALRDRERLLEPDRMALAAMSDRMARELSAFNQGRQAQLDSLMDKLARERQLSDQEFELANTLAQQERQYEQTLEQLREEARLTEEANEREREFEEEQGALDRALERDLAQLEAQTSRQTSGTTGTERIAGSLAGVSDEVERILASERNEGEPQGDFATIAAYRRAKQKALEEGVPADQFDEQYSNRLSPADRIRYGIGTTTNVRNNSSSGGDPFGIDF